jgi:glycerol-3-phosphate acyltransferase PlsY
LLTVYGIVSGLFATFTNYFIYLDMDVHVFMVILNPLLLIVPLSTLNIMIIGCYPFTMIALGFYIVISHKKKVKRIGKKTAR